MLQQVRSSQPTPPKDGQVYVVPAKGGRIFLVNFGRHIPLVSAVAVWFKNNGLSFAGERTVRMLTEVRPNLNKEVGKKTMTVLGLEGFTSHFNSCQLFCARWVQEKGMNTCEIFEANSDLFFNGFSPEFWFVGVVEEVSKT